MLMITMTITLTVMRLKASSVTAKSTWHTIIIVIMPRSILLMDIIGQRLHSL